MSPAGSEYRFKVTAINYVGEGPLSNEITVIAATEPDQPLPPTKTGSSKTTISISWTAPNSGGSPILSYTILSKDANSAGLFTDITTAGVLDVAARTFTTDSSLTTGSSYYFKVLATNTVDVGPESNQSVAMIAAIVPSVPTSLAKLSSSSDTISV